MKSLKRSRSKILLLWAFTQDENNQFSCRQIVQLSAVDVARSCPTLNHDLVDCFHMSCWREHSTLKSTINSLDREGPEIRLEELHEAIPGMHTTKIRETDQLLPKREYILDQKQHFLCS